MAKLTREQAGVKAGDKIIVKGIVAFARLDKAVTGDALVRENERRAKLGMIPTKEFRSIAIEEPEIVKGENTPLANYYGQRIYTGSTSGKPTLSVESKSLYPPQYGHIVNGVIQEIADPKRNPAPGQVVYLMISAFAPKGFNNLGSSFDAVVFEEGPIQFYEGNNSLTGFGQALNMKVEPLAQQPVEVVFEQQEQPQQAVGGGFANTNGGFANAPVSNPAQPTPFGVQDTDLAPNNTAAQPTANPFGQSTPFGGTSGQTSANPFG